MRLLITGASGLVGRTLCQGLSTLGHHCTPMIRQKPGAINPEGHPWWDPLRRELDRQGLSEHQAVLHLAGENIAGGRWTTARKRRIRESRVRGTELLATSLAGLDQGPRLLICASAVGFYGNRPPEERLTEQSELGAGFLPQVCRQWEEAASPAAEAGIRVVFLRLGIVLHPEDGALGRMLIPFKLGLGGPVGNGRQMMSWIAAEELPPLVDHLLQQDSLHGPVNGVSPHPVSNTEFSKTLGRVLSRPAIMPLPAIAARLLLGEMAEELLIGGAAVLPQTLLDSGYQFTHPRLEPALRAMLDR